MSTTHALELIFPWNRKLLKIATKISDSLHFLESFRTGTSRYYAFSPAILKIVVDALGGIDAMEKSGFEIDENIKLQYNEMQDILSNRKKYVPSFDSGKLLNISPAGIEFITNEIDITDPLNWIKIYDRRAHYGIVDFYNFPSLPDTLVGEIVTREYANIALDLKVTDLDCIVNALDELDRFPLLVILDSCNMLQNIQIVHDAISKKIPNHQQSVLCRTKNINAYSFNDFIKDNNLNNQVDKNTKVVYISNTKLPKIVQEHSQLTSALICRHTTNYRTSVYLQSVVNLGINISLRT